MFHPRYYTNSEGVLTAEIVGKVDVEMSDMRVVHTVGVTQNYFILPRSESVRTPSHV